MYQLERITSYYNYDECVITVEMFLHDSENLNEVYKKCFPNDKSTAEMKALTAKWSLTTLSINTGKSPGDLVQQFGHPFKRCYVRPLYICVDFDVNNKLVKTFTKVEVSLNARFSNSQFIQFSNESPLTDEFSNSLQKPSKAGYFPVKK